MGDERGPDELANDLMQLLRCLAASDASRRHPASVERFEPAVRVLARQVHRIGTSRKARRRLAWQVAAFVVALERWFCRTGDSGSSYGPTVHTVAQTVMEWCPAVERPGDEAARLFYDGLLRAVTITRPTDGVKKTYEEIVATYRLRPQWAVAIGLSRLFA